MSIFIHNSLSKKKEEFTPLNPPKVNLYSCGVTVYDDCHIGHGRSLYIFEVIKRYLEYRGFKVNFVRNITDIDDKIINRANELKIEWGGLVAKYIDSYYEDLKALGIEKADAEPRATQNIEEMKAYINALIEKGFAYVADTGVYFSVRKFKDYGKLSGQSIDQMLTGVRKDSDETKEDPLDFALWKRSKPGEPFWPSPWGDGRPGWHIECSVMSAKYLKTDTLDIHAGGRDLIFPHHENEIAQAEALTGKPFARYWIHHGLLTINAQKMSKSLGNFITIKDFLNKYKDADLLKLFFLSAHYSHPIDYNEAKIKEAGESQERIFNLLHKIETRLAKADSSKFQLKKIDEIEKIRSEFIRAMDDDFNTPEGMGALFKLVSIANKNINDLEFLFNVNNVLLEMAEVLGLEFKQKTDIWEFLPPLQEALIKKRDEAKKKRDFKEADKIRKELEDQGIVLEDTKEGTVWKKKFLI
jgi:cysteinyl-tRNA synthetase